MFTVGLHRCREAGGVRCDSSQQLGISAARLDLANLTRLGTLVMIAAAVSVVKTFVLDVFSLTAI